MLARTCLGWNPLPSPWPCGLAEPVCSPSAPASPAPSVPTLTGLTLSLSPAHTHTCSSTADPPTCSLTAILHALTPPHKLSRTHIHFTHHPYVCVCLLPHTHSCILTAHPPHPELLDTPYTACTTPLDAPHAPPTHPTILLAQPTPAFSLLQPERSLPKIPLGLLLIPAQKLPSSTPS